jgi:hypothetical protein
VGILEPPGPTAVLQKDAVCGDCDRQAHSMYVELRTDALQEGLTDQILGLAAIRRILVLPYDFHRLDEIKEYM